MVLSGLQLQYQRGLVLHEGAFINDGCFIDAKGGVLLGAGVHLADGVSLNSSTHEVGPSYLRAGRSVSRAIRVGDGAWLGSGVRVIAGVTIGPGCVVAAGSVVVRDCIEDGLYAGVPAVWKRSLNEA